MPSDILTKLKFIYEGGRPNRFHTYSCAHPQSVAEHSFYVAHLIMLLYGEDHPNVAVRLMGYALIHDLAEHKTGDMRSDVKRKFPDLKRLLDEAEDDAYAEAGLAPPKLTAEEKRMFKMADNLDGLIYCLDERRRGNTTLHDAFINYRQYILASNPTANGLAIFNHVCAEYHTFLTEMERHGYHGS